MIITMTVVLVLLTVAVSSAVAATDGPEEVIRALYEAHRLWEHKQGTPSAGRFEAYFKLFNELQEKTK